MRRLYARLAAMLMLALLPVVAAVAALTPAAAQDTGSGASLPIFGVLQDENGDVGTFQGTVTNLAASGSDDALNLDGVINGLATIDGDAVRITDQEFSSPAEPSVVGSINAEDYSPGEADAAATPVGSSLVGAKAFSMQTADDAGKCDILFLDIQPITLNLLGLELLTSPITIDLNAIPGDGNLLGNLLCAVAGLLDPSSGLDTGGLGSILDGLNQIFDGLNQIFGGAGAADTAGITSAVDDTATGTPDAADVDTADVDVDADATVDPDADVDVDAGVDVDGTPALDVDADANVDAGVDADADAEVDADADVDANVDVDPDVTDDDEQD